MEIFFQIFFQIKKKQLLFKMTPQRLLPYLLKYSFLVSNTLLTNSHNALSLSVPCAPTNITTNLLCGTNDLMVSWIPPSAALNYSVRAVPLVVNVSSVTCVTAQANCSLATLQCGRAYNVSVKASSGSCSSPYSHPQTVQTGEKDEGRERIH